MSAAGLDCSDIRGANGRSYVPRTSDIQNGVGVSVSAIGASNSASDPVTSEVIEVGDHNWTGTKPSTATTGSATVQALGTEATLGGAIVPGFSDWGYRFRWGVVGDSKVHDAYGSSVDPCTGGYALPSCGQGTYVGNTAQAVTVHLAGLSPNATYWYQLVAYNSDAIPKPPNNEIDGAVHRFRASTAGGPPLLQNAQFVDGPHPRVDVQVFPGGKPATIAVSWSGPDVQTRSNDVHIDLGPDPGASTVVPLPLPFTPQKTLPYQYTITAITDAGSATANGAFSSGLAPAPQALYPTAIGSTTATLAADLHTDWIGLVDQGYANHYEADAELWAAGDTAPVPGSPGTQSMFLASTDENLKTPEQPTHLLSGLSPGTTYHYQVSLDVGSLNSGDSTLQVLESNVIQFTTANAAPAGSASTSSSAFSMQMSCLTANGCSGSFESTPSAPFAAGGATAATAARGLADARARRTPHASANPVLAYGRYRIAAHGHAVIRVRLTRTGRRWLRGHPHVRRLSVAIHNANARRGAVSRAWVELRRTTSRSRR